MNCDDDMCWAFFETKKVKKIIIILQVKIASIQINKKWINLTITMIKRIWHDLLKLLNQHDKNDCIMIIMIINHNNRNKMCI